MFHVVVFEPIYLNILLFTSLSEDETVAIPRDGSRPNTPAPVRSQPSEGKLPVTIDVSRLDLVPIIDIHIIYISGIPYTKASLQANQLLPSCVAYL